MLRRWRAEDLEPFAVMNADPAVMEHFPAPLSSVESAALVERFEACFQEHGYGLWAVEILDEAPFVGFVGLFPVDIEVAFASAVEVGWRLARPFWGQGLATEAAQVALTFAFDELNLTQIVSFTAASNTRSRRVMERLGMKHNPKDDFEHPDIPEGSPLRPHVLYRIDRTCRRFDSSPAGALP